MPIGTDLSLLWHGCHARSRNLRLDPSTPHPQNSAPVREGARHGTRALLTCTRNCGSVSRCRSIYLSICLCIYRLSIYLSIYLSIRLSIYRERERESYRETEHHKELSYFLLGAGPISTLSAPRKMVHTQLVHKFGRSCVVIQGCRLHVTLNRCFVLHAPYFGVRHFSHAASGHLGKVHGTATDTGRNLVDLCEDSWQITNHFCCRRHSASTNSQTNSGADPLPSCQNHICESLALSALNEHSFVRSQSFSTGSGASSATTVRKESELASWYAQRACQRHHQKCT